ncbi:MAG: DEAD/DEAH box helicase [bacterium]|nr:DEAD/DEAH box helicase [bacterium]
MIKDFTPRLYQETILATCVNHNCLVVLPTGMGKTNVFLLLAVQRLNQYPDSKVLFIGPTRPLIDQYLEVFKKFSKIDEKDMVVFTGQVAPAKRAELWKKARVIFSTPQGLENDIISNKISLENVSLLGVDEAHRAVGDYSYVWIAKQYHRKASFPRIIALTASPGSDMEKITEVCKNLYIEEIEVRTAADPDVKPYIQDVKIDWIKVNLPEEFIEVKKFLEGCLREKLQELKKYGFLKSAQTSYVNKKDLLGLQAALHMQISRGEKDFQILKSVSLLAEVMKVQHALELLETQGISALQKYFDKLWSESRTTKVKAVKNLVADLNFRSANIKTKKLFDEHVEHPKLKELMVVVSKETNDDSKIIVFNQYRDSAQKIEEELNKVEGVKAKLFVGQMKKGETGLSQKEQKKVLEQFRDCEYNVLVATSIGEEGLDIPKVDLVVFYEPIPSAIRQIQRRGRTGRLEKGKVIVLMAKGTRDEAYSWVARRKEKKMHDILRNLKDRMKFTKKSDHSLKQFIQEEDVTVFADIREKGSGVIKELADCGVTIDLKTLNVGDYICSRRCGIEFKTVGDFVDSIIDGRLLHQLKDLKSNFERPVVIIEGEEDIFSVRKVHPNAIRGMLATIAVSYGIPILYTKNFKETAALILTIAKREQKEVANDFSQHTRKPLTLKEQQEYIVSSLPGVGPAIAGPLLKRFGSVKKVVNASQEKLKDVDLIGDKKSKEIKRIIDSDYES